MPLRPNERYRCDRFPARIRKRRRVNALDVALPREKRHLHRELHRDHRFAYGKTFVIRRSRKRRGSARAITRSCECDACDLKPPPPPPARKFANSHTHSCSAVEKFDGANYEMRNICPLNFRGKLILNVTSKVSRARYYLQTETLSKRSRNFYPTKQTDVGRVPFSPIKVALLSLAVEAMFEIKFT